MPLDSEQLFRGRIMKTRSIVFIVLPVLLTLAVKMVSAATVDELMTQRIPEAIIDLATGEGLRIVKGEWRYSDTKIVEVDFTAADVNGQPGNKSNKAYDFSPHAGTVDFDDANWEVIPPAMLDQRRSAGRLAFNWYRIKITVPDRVGDFDPRGSTLVFTTSVDDYAEIWVDGEIPRATAQSGGSVIKGWNAENRLIIARDIKPGQKIQLAIFGINGPISNPPTNYIYMRYAKLEFHRAPTGPVALTPQEINVRSCGSILNLTRSCRPIPRSLSLPKAFNSLKARSG